MRPGWPVLGGVVATLVIGVAGCNTPADRLEQQFAQNQWLQENQASIFQDVSAPAPALKPVTHFAAGQLFENQQQFSRAIIQYRKAIALNPKFTVAYNRIGICLDNLGQHGQAEQAFRQAILLEPELSHLRNNLAFNLMVQHRWTDAEEELREALFLKPGYERARTNLGIVLAKQSRDAEALASFRMVLGEALANYNMGLLLKSDHRYTEAAESFRRAVRHEPRFTAAKVQLDNLRTLALARDSTITPKLTATARNFDRARTSSTLDKIAEPVDDATSLQTRVEANPAPPLTEEQVAVTDAQDLEMPQTDPALPVVLATPDSVTDQPAVHPIDSTPSGTVQEEVQEDADAFAHVELPSVFAQQAPAEPTLKVKTAESLAPEPPPETLPAATVKPHLPQAAVIGDRKPSVLEPPALPLSLPVTLCNQPCEAVGMQDRLARLQEQLKPCLEDEYVDQFFFEGAGYEPEPVAVLPATKSPPLSAQGVAPSRQSQGVASALSPDSSRTREVRRSEFANRWSLKQQFRTARGSRNLFHLSPYEAFQSKVQRSHARSERHLGEDYLSPSH